MADGILCKHCGRQETDHVIKLEDADELVEGYPRTLLDCDGYEPEDADLACELQERARNLQEQTSKQALRNMGIVGDPE